MNDLLRSISSQVFLSADDTKIMRSISTLTDHVQLQTDLDNLDKYVTRGSSILMLLNTKVSSILVELHTVMETTTFMVSYWTQLIVTKTWAFHFIQV